MTGTCDDCAYQAYDEEYEDYICGAYLDEDELLRVLQRGSGPCPYYRPGDDYALVRHQN